MATNDSTYSPDSVHNSIQAYLLQFSGVDEAEFCPPQRDWLDDFYAETIVINAELAQQGLRRASILDGEAGWYVMTSYGKVWATDLPERGS